MFSEFSSEGRKKKAFQVKDIFIKFFFLHLDVIIHKISYLLLRGISIIYKKINKSDVYRVFFKKLKVFK